MMKNNSIGACSHIRNVLMFQPASARGIGIRVVHKWNQIPKRRPVIVQR